MLNRFSIVFSLAVTFAALAPDDAFAQAVMRLSTPSNPQGQITAATPNWNKPRNDPTWIDPSINLDSMMVQPYVNVGGNPWGPWNNGPRGNGPAGVGGPGGPAGVGGPAGFGGPRGAGGPAGVGGPAGFGGFGRAGRR